MANMPTRRIAMCLGPEGQGGFEIREVPRRKPGPNEVEIAVEAASVNPIDVKRAAGYGRRLLALMGASRFPMALGNDFSGVVAAVGSERAPAFAIGERVYGVRPQCYTNVCVNGLQVTKCQKLSPLFRLGHRVGG